MIKLVFCLRRREGLSREAFQRYWREDHARLVEERAVVLGVRRYVQVHTLDQAGLHAAFQARNDSSPEPFDGVAELWFDSLDAFGSGDDAVAVAGAELLADERTFIDLSRSPMWVAEEHTVVRTPTGAAPIIPAGDVDAVVDSLLSVGFTCGPDGRFGEPGGPTVYATVALGETPLHVQARAHLPFDHYAEHETDAYLYVPDVDDMHDRCVASGFEILRPLYEEAYGMRDFTVRLVEGQRIAFGAPISDLRP